MKTLLSILVGLISIAVIAQTNSDIQTDYALTKEEASYLNLLFEKKRNDFDFQGKIIAYTIGATGTQIEDKSVFFDKYLNYAIIENNKNVCVLIILTKEEKTKSGGFDAVIMSPAKVFTTKHRNVLVRELAKLSNAFSE
jgi:hypothetical protein